MGNCFENLSNNNLCNSDKVYNETQFDEFGEFETKQMNFSYFIIAILKEHHIVNI